MYTSLPRAQRIRAASASACAVIAVTWAMLSGLNVKQIMQVAEPLVSVDLTPAPPKPPEPPRERPKPVRKSAAKKAASARNLRGKATAVVAPVVRPIKLPPPIIAAPKPGTGNAANNGAANRPGAGQGAGGVGNGRGGGGDGGDGDGDTPPEHIAGKLHFADLPPEIASSLREGTVGVRYYVDVDGHAKGCRITDPSGNSALDALTCRLIQERFRFNPSRDITGRPLRSIIVQSHSWGVDRSAMDRGR